MRKLIIPFLSIGLCLGIVSCAKSKVKKDIQGSWNLDNITQDDVDFFDLTGSTIGGVWTFNKETYDWELITGTGTDSGTGSYEIADAETIDFDGNASVPVMTIETLNSTTLVLTYTNEYVNKHFFTRL